MTRRPIEAVLCDVDGVLRIWEGEETAALERQYGLASGSIAAAAFEPSRLARALTGAIGDEEWRADVARALEPACGSPAAAAAVVRRWTARTGRIDEDVLALLTRARQAVPVVLVSNGTTRLEDDLAMLGVSPALPVLANSARLGVAKPDRAIYLAAAAAAGVPAESCLFIDDVEAFVRAAEALGMTGVLYGGVADLRRALADVLG